MEKITPELRERWARVAPKPLPEVEKLAEARERIRRMSPKQLRQSFVDAGIYDASGTLRPEYGGND